MLIRIAYITKLYYFYDKDDDADAGADAHHVGLSLLLVDTEDVKHTHPIFPCVCRLSTT